jgi:hypothetical protein
MTEIKLRRRHHRQGKQKQAKNPEMDALAEPCGADQGCKATDSSRRSRQRREHAFPTASVSLWQNMFLEIQ